MQQRLSHLVEPLPVVASFTTFADLAQIFVSQPKLDAVLVTPVHDGEPYGLLCRAGAFRPTYLFPDEEISRFANYNMMRCYENSCLSDFRNVERKIMKYGLVYYEGECAKGYISPKRLAQFHADQGARLRGERDDARAALTQALEQRLHVLADMGHELRSPLNSIIGYSDLMQQQIKGPLGAADYIEYAKAIYHAGGHLLSVINAVLDMAKVDAGTVGLNEEHVSLRQVCAKAVDIMRPMTDKAHVNILIKIDGNVPDIYVDPQIFLQILINLLSNAIKFSPADSAIRVTGRVDRRGFLRLTVIDRGPGISPEDIKRVMKPFHQAGQARHGVGTGLGLPLVKSLCALHDSHFQLLSEEGRGTRAVVTLPPGRVHGRRPSGQGEFIFTCGIRQA
ncbi:MAG: ATP-binding protein [Sphingomonadales bacterium]|jgi:two-component system cell cycle sensor histidine kinase PleC